VQFFPGAFTWGKAAGVWLSPPTPSSADMKGFMSLYIASFTFTLKIEKAGSSCTLVLLYQTWRYYIPEYVFIAVINFTVIYCTSRYIYQPDKEHVAKEVAGEKKTVRIILPLKHNWQTAV
jgi:hypothetical protein